MTLRDLVKKLQRALNAAGTSPTLTEDGQFGPKTAAAGDRFDIEIKLTKKKTKTAPVDGVSFFSVVSSHFGPLKISQVEGFHFILAKWAESGHADLRWLAYMLATAWHETARTMQPITEYGSDAYLKAKPYWPFIGRGYVQLTWKSNYEKYGIAATPSRALDPHLAAHILIDGMVKGIFTGKKLSDYFNDHTNDPVGARRIINGTDRAQEIAKTYAVFLNALTADDRLATPAPTSSAPWLDELKKYEGKKETDPAFNKEMSAKWSLVGLNLGTIAKNWAAWCGLFVAVGLAGVGITWQKNGAGAKNWDKYGVEIDWKVNGIPRGAIVRINHAGKCSSSSDNHVTLSDGDCAPADLKKSGAHFNGYGGNQSNTAKVSAFPVAHICSVSWPEKDQAGNPIPRPLPVVVSKGCIGKSGGESTR